MASNKTTIANQATTRLSAAVQRIQDRLRLGPLKLSVFRETPVILTDEFGIRFVLYPWNHLALKNVLRRETSRREFAALPHLIREGDTVFDVGANIGLHAVYMSRYVGTEGKVFAFEPVPDTFQLLRETLALNACDTVTAVPVALGDKRETRQINVFDVSHSAWNSFGVPNFGGTTPQHSVEVRIETLDDFCAAKGISRIDFMKIDVEGFEKQVFDGARRLLETKAIRALSFEVSKIPLAGMGASSQELFDVLARFGYHVYVFDDRTDAFKGPVHGSGDESFDNYFAFSEPRP